MTDPSKENPLPGSPVNQGGGAVQPGAAAQPAAEVEGNVTQGSAPVVPSGEPGPQVVAVRRGMFGVSGTGDTSGYGGMTTTVVMPGAAQRPYGGWFDEVVDILQEVLDEDAGGAGGFTEAIESVVIHREQLTLVVRRQHLLRVARALRDDPDLRFEMCMGVNGVHYPLETGRELHAVYPLKSITHRRRLMLEVACPEADPHIPSITSVYPSNNWHERETWDFFGIIFDGHPALTRIQMPDDWPGHPQRKDYPLGGIPVEFKGASIPAPDQRRQYR